jgi:hypothetical protein
MCRYFTKSKEDIMLKQLNPSAVNATVARLEPTKSGRYVWVHFTAPVRVPGAFANYPYVVSAPMVCATRMSLKKFMCRDIRTGDRVQVAVEGRMHRPSVVRVFLEERMADPMCI